MTRETMYPTTLLGGANRVYRFVFFGVRYVAGAFWAGLVAVSVAFVTSAFARLGIVGGLVLGLTVALFLMVLAILAPKMLDALIRPFYRTPGFAFNVAPTTGDVVITPATEADSAERVMLMYQEDVISIQWANKKLLPISLAVVESIRFVNDTAEQLDTMHVRLRTGQTFAFVLSAESTRAWRAALEASHNYTVLAG